MNLARVQYHMLKRAADAMNPMDQMATPDISQYMKAIPAGARAESVRAAVQRGQEPQAAQAPAQSVGPLQSIWNGVKGAFQNGQQAGQQIQEYAQQNPLLPWENGTREHLGDTYTENARRLANAWDYGAQLGERTAEANAPHAENIYQGLRQIQANPQAAVQDVRNAGQNGTFSNALSSAISWFQNRQQQQAAARKAQEAQRQTNERAWANRTGSTNESRLADINRASLDFGGYNYSIPVDQWRSQNMYDPSGSDQQAADMSYQFRR